MSLILLNKTFNNPKIGRLETPREILDFAVDNINAKVPMLLDESTRLDYATGISNLELNYNYTMFSGDPLEIKKKWINLMEPTIRKKISTNSDLKIFSDNGIVIIYSYFDNDGREIAKIKMN